MDKSSDYWWHNERWLCDYWGKMLADVLINFDQLPGSALKFLHRIGISIDEFPHLNER